MRILWITNIILPEASSYLKIKKSVVGGWMEGLLGCLKLDSDINIAVASVYKGGDLIEFKKDGVTYFLIPSKKDTRRYNPTLETHWLEVSTKFSPDLVHIHGTEHAHGLAMMNACPENKFVVSIQGLVSVYSKYYMAGISIKDIVLNYTIKDIIKGSILKGKKDYRIRGKNEIEYIQKANDIIGRTRWDESHSYFINKIRKYHFCNEVLRESFYESDTSWSFPNIEKHSIFLSQGAYPIKGLHYMLKAVALLKDEYPNIKIYIGGNNLIKDGSFIDGLNLSGYGKYIISLLKEYKLLNCVKFTGQLRAAEMKQMYIKSHVFVCPSSIENSPNSLGEAQILGVPCIGSYVGGVPDMISNKENGLLYRFEEYEELAYCIRDIFNNKKLAISLSENAKISAATRHDREVIKKNTLSIYNSIVNK